MPRKARIDAPGALHHIIIRGIERKDIFIDDRDRENFLERIGRHVSSTNTNCFAWALMPNHVHLLIRTGLAPIAAIMRRVLTGYAVSFNRRHRRHGHLFQNRYKSFLCEEQPYLRELVRYIHLNPLRASAVTDIMDLQKHPWCGHAAIMGTCDNSWQDTDYVLRLFGRSVKNARRAYESYVAMGVAQGRRPDLVGGGLLRSVGGWSALNEYRTSGKRIKGDERILGSTDFVERVLEQANEQLDEKYRLEAAGISLPVLMKNVSRYFGVEAENLRTSSKERTVTRARRVFCFLAVRRLRFSCADVSRELGISPATVSKAVSMGQELSEIVKIQNELVGTAA